MKILSINHIDKQLVCDASISTKVILLIPISNYTTIIWYHNWCIELSL